MKQIINIKRAYEPVSSDGGFRIYIDRLWSRGLSHETFHCDWWDKKIAPSTELREWFHISPLSEWSEFEKRYRLELMSNPAFASLKKMISDKPRVTLLCSSRDEIHNNAIVLHDLLVSDSSSRQI